MAADGQNSPACEKHRAMTGAACLHPPGRVECTIRRIVQLGVSDGRATLVQPTGD